MAVSRMFSRGSCTLGDRAEQNDLERELAQDANKKSQTQNPVTIVAKALFRLMKTDNNSK